MIVSDILIPGLKTISPDATMSEAEKFLKQENIRHLPVKDGKTIIGIITDTDVSRSSVLLRFENEKKSHIQDFKKVRDYMSSPVHKKKINDSLEELIRDMISLKISCFIIDDLEDNSIGIITSEDLLILLLEKIQKKLPGNLFSRFF